MDDKRDLLILGGGLVGMTLALAAARKGLSSHVVDRADPAELTAEGFDGRASAISTASWNLFRNIGLADALEPHGCPIETIAVSDQLKPGRIDFRPEPHEGSLGRMFANRTLRLALFEAAAAEPLIAWHARSEVIGRERGEHEDRVHCIATPVLEQHQEPPFGGELAPPCDELHRDAGSRSHVRPERPVYRCLGNELLHR